MFTCILIVLLCICSLNSVYGKTILHLLFLTVGEQKIQMNVGFFLSQMYDDKFQRS